MASLTIKEGAFRVDTDRYFELSGIRRYKKLNHTPFLVIEDNVASLCFNARDLVANYGADAEVFSQWSGQYKSDYFYFKIKDFVDYINKKPKEESDII